MHEYGIEGGAKYKTWQAWETAIVKLLRAGGVVIPTFRGVALEPLTPVVLPALFAHQEAVYAATTTPADTLGDVAARCPTLYPFALEPQCAAIRADTNVVWPPIRRRAGRPGGWRMKAARDRLELGFIAGDDIDAILHDLSTILRGPACRTR